MMTKEVAVAAIQEEFGVTIAPNIVAGLSLKQLLAIAATFRQARANPEKEQ